MKPSDDLMDWLGPAAEELTPDQIDTVKAEAARIAEYWPDEDDQDKRDAAMSAVVRYLLGEVTAEDTRRELDEARRRERHATIAATWVGVMLVRDGGEKKGSALAVGVDRMTLLKALGERPRQGEPR